MIGVLLIAAICNCEVCPERMNDFVWENDKFGMRAYGPGEYHKWSGWDVFNKMKDATSSCTYMMHHHNDCGKWHATPYGGILDNYTMGVSRGVGGIAIFVADPSEVEAWTDHMNCRVLAFKKPNFTYWAGASWSLAGEITTPDQWHECVRSFQRKVKAERGAK